MQVYHPAHASHIINARRMRNSGNLQFSLCVCGVLNEDVGDKLRAAAAELVAGI